jgi:catechol 2,3-dioxygenase-like lactoylglutathione lyase family enzyme
MPMPALLEHANYTVTDPAATARWMQAVFGWHIRWQGAAIDGGHTVHVGTQERYVALYAPVEMKQDSGSSYTHVGGLNHIAVVVDDYEATEERVRAQGFRCGEHYDYEPGRRFYFHDDDDIEYEVVSYT